MCRDEVHATDMHAQAGVVELRLVFWQVVRRTESISRRLDVDISTQYTYITSPATYYYGGVGEEATLTPWLAARLATWLNPE